MLLQLPALDQRYRDPGGWTKTGDLGVLDADGYLRTAGRIRDIGIAKTKLPERLELVDEMPLNPPVRSRSARCGARIAQILEQEQAPAGA